MAVTVRQKVKGRGKPWSVFIHVNGTIRSKSIGDRPAANKVASLLRKKMAAGELNLDPAKPRRRSPEFSAYAEYYLAKTARRTCKHSTWIGYNSVLKTHLIPAFKGRLLNQITRAEVKDFLLNKQQAGYARGTLNNMKNLLSAILMHACDAEILTANPSSRVGRYLQKNDLRHSICPLTREQASTFLLAALEEYPQHHPLFLCAFRTGMRMGELLALAWSDIDWAANTITVQRAYTCGKFGTPKSHKFRIVDMSDQLKRALLGHCDAVRQRFGGRLPVHSVPGRNNGTTLVELVFPSATGGPISGDNLRSRVFYPLIEKADVPRFRFHDIRHTFASMLLANGESLHYVKEQMGHSSIATTVDIYGHLVPGSNRRAVNRLDDAEEPTLRVLPANAG